MVERRIDVPPRFGLTSGGRIMRHAPALGSGRRLLHTAGFRPAPIMRRLLLLVSLLVPACAWEHATQLTASRIKVHGGAVQRRRARARTTRSADDAKLTTRPRTANMRSGLRAQQQRLE
jgi:hypothetical protein